VQAEQSPVQEAGQQAQVQGDIVGLVGFGGLVWLVGCVGWLCWLWKMLCEDCCRAWGKDKLMGGRGGPLYPWIPLQLSMSTTGLSVSSGVGGRTARPTFAPLPASLASSLPSSLKARRRLGDSCLFVWGMSPPLSCPRPTGCMKLRSREASTKDSSSSGSSLPDRRNSDISPFEIIRRSRPSIHGRIRTSSLRCLGGQAHIPGQAVRQPVHPADNFETLNPACRRLASQPTNHRHHHILHSSDREAWMSRPHQQQAISLSRRPCAHDQYKSQLPPWIARRKGLRFKGFLALTVVNSLAC